MLFHSLRIRIGKQSVVGKKNRRVRLPRMVVMQMSLRNERTNESKFFSRASSFYFQIGFLIGDIWTECTDMSRIIQLEMFALHMFIQMVKFRGRKWTFLTRKNTFRYHFVTLRHSTVSGRNIRDIWMLNRETFSRSAPIQSASLYSFENIWAE